MAPETVAALGRVRESGRRLVMVTGRQFADLLAVCPEIGLFDLVVAENGAVVYDPRGKKSKTSRRRPRGLPPRTR
jgi:hydroxymethylpyrimidine pyrophosphatase-like HAD family hydrolase